MHLTESLLYYLRQRKTKEDRHANFETVRCSPYKMAKKKFSEMQRAALIAIGLLAVLLLLGSSFPAPIAEHKVVEKTGVIAVNVAPPAETTTGIVKVNVIAPPGS